MAQIYMIPDSAKKIESLELALSENLKFEFNDFFTPAILQNEEKCQGLIKDYGKLAGITEEFLKDCTLHGAFLDVTIHSQDSEIAEISKRRMIQSMECAKALGVRGVVFHTGLLRKFHTDAYIANWKAVNVPFMKELLRKFPDQEIWMENMFDDKLEPLAALAQELKDEPRFGICLDYAHLCLYGKEEPEKWFSTFSSQIKHIHINDNMGSDDDHLPVGEGVLDWKLFQKLRVKYASDASVLIEVSGLEGIKQSLNKVRTLLES